MGFFDLFGDPAAKWTRSPGLRMELDLRQASLCGVKLGSRADGLCVLGAPSNPKPSKNGYYLWRDLGIDAHARDGILRAFTLSVDMKDVDPDLGEYAGSFLLDGKPLALGRTIRKEDAIRLLGEPWHEFADPDDDEISRTLWYETRTLEWTLEFGAKGTLASVVIASPPELAEATTRRHVKCDKPWPP